MENLTRANQQFGWASIIFAFLILVVLFVLIPLPGGDDWQTFYGAAQRVLDGSQLYGTKITFSYYYNPPWLAVLLSSLGLLPFRWGWGIVSVISIFNVFMLCRRWNMGAIKLVAILLSPPMLYTLLHGNVDGLVLGAVLLPREYWLIAAITKPQTLIALSIGAFYANRWKMVAITAGVILLSFVMFGNWLVPFLNQPLELVNAGHNVFRGLWPFQLVVGAVLAWMGWRRQDELYWVGASPFFSPYAATSTLLGPLMFVVSKVKGWQAMALVALYWACAVLFR